MPGAADLATLRSALNTATLDKERATRELLTFLATDQVDAASAKTAISAAEEEDRVLGGEEDGVLASLDEVQSRLALFDSVASLSPEAAARRAKLAAEEEALLAALDRVQTQRGHVRHALDGLDRAGEKRRVQREVLERAQVAAEAALRDAMAAVADAEGGGREGREVREARSDDGGYLRAQLVRVSGEKDEVLKEYQGLREMYEKDIRTLNAERLELVTRIDHLQAQNMRLSDQLAHALAEGDDWRAQYETELQEKNDLAVQLDVIRELRGDESQIAAVASSLTDEIMALRATNDSLEDSLRSSKHALVVEQRKSIGAAESASASQELAEAKKVIAQLQDQAQALQAELDDVQGGLQFERDQVARLQGEVEELEVEHGEEVAAMEERFQARVRELQDQCDAATAAATAAAATTAAAEAAAAEAAAAEASPEEEALAREHAVQVVELQEQTEFMSKTIQRLEARLARSMQIQARVETKLDTAPVTTQAQAPTQVIDAASADVDSEALMAQVEALEAENAEQAYLVRLLAQAVETTDLGPALGGQAMTLQAKVETLAHRLLAKLSAPPPVPSHVDPMFADHIASLERDLDTTSRQLAAATAEISRLQHQHHP